MREDEAEYSPSGSYDKEEYNEDEDELESGEFDSHILQMFFFSNIWSLPPRGCKRSSFSPRGLPISIRRVLQH